MEKKSNYLFVTIDGGGNIPPVLGLANGLRERGHQVTILTEPCLEPVITSLGLNFISFKEYFTRTDRKEDICKDWNATLFNQPTFDNILFGPAEIVIKETLQAIKKTDAGILVMDVLLPPGLIAGEICNIPRVILFHMPEYMPGPNRPPGVMGLTPGKGIFGRFRDRVLMKVFNIKLNSYLPKINKIRAFYELQPLKNLSDLLHGADLRLIQTTELFDFPIKPVPKNVRYIGPILDDPDWANEWENPWTEDDSNPLIVISLSTTFQNQAAVIQSCIDALSGIKVRGLVTLGLAMEDELFSLPENVKLIKSAPHSQVFPHSDAVITHGGHGTIMRALSFGLPIICLPMGRDQKDNAAKVVHHGLGLKLSKKSSPKDITRAIHEILENPSYRSKAKKMGMAILEDCKAERGIMELEKLAWINKKVQEPAPNQLP
ncbi:glycosyltransferase [Shivajiella indica]|uniref:Glycosyltransferase n=1 Tax=Shivajiella indica TaxID=872115 RepID=A0ABW5BBB5_9BACT